MPRSWRVAAGVLAVLLAGPAGSAAAGEPAARSAAPETPAPSSRRGSIELELACRAVFRDFASRNQTAALARAAELERAASATSASALELLGEVEHRLLVELGKRRPRALLELVLFYQELAQLHVRESEWTLVGRANRTIRSILDTLAELTRKDPSRAVVAAAYQAWAVDLLARRATVSAGEALVAALALTPDDAAANLALAILLQREGRYEEAVEFLDQALAVEPGHREARLRRAVLAARDPDDEAAGAELEALANGGERDWIAALAAEERARQLLDGERHREAAAWLEPAVEKFPQEAALHVALAYARRQLGQRVAAAEAARAALASTGGDEPSARRRYGDSPARLLVARRHELRQSVEASWGELQIALGPIVTIGGGAGEGVER